MVEQVQDICTVDHCKDRDHAMTDIKQQHEHLTDGVHYFMSMTPHTTRSEYTDMTSLFPS